MAAHANCLEYPFFTMFPYRQPQIYLQIFVQFQVLLFFSPTDIFFGPNPQKLNHVE